MKTLLDFIDGHVSPKDIILDIQQSSREIDTPEKRFQILMKLMWFCWSTQTWNSNFTGISYEKFCEKHQHYFVESCKDVVAQWVRTGSITHLID